VTQFNQYYGRFQGFRGQFGGLPQWARTIVGIFAIPGIVLLALSIIAFVVSLLALLLLTVPVYSLLRRLTSGQPEAGRPMSQSPFGVVFSPPAEVPPSGTKRVDSTIVE
jgi:uncharacterized protein (DUF58 family)